MKTKAFFAAAIACVCLMALPFFLTRVSSQDAPAVVDDQPVEDARLIVDSQLTEGEVTLPYTGDVGSVPTHVIQGIVSIGGRNAVFYSLAEKTVILPSGHIAFINLKTGGRVYISAGTSAVAAECAVTPNATLQAAMDAAREEQVPVEPIEVAPEPTVDESGEVSPPAEESPIADPGPAPEQTESDQVSPIEEAEESLPPEPEATQE